MTGRLGSRVVVDDAAVPGPWVAQAVCADHDRLDFTDDQHDVDEKRAVCACPVAQPCHAWAMTAGTPGVAAGTTAKQRQTARRTHRHHARRVA